MNDYTLQNYVVQLLGWSEESTNSLNPEQKKIWESGELNDPKMVTEWLVEAMRNIWEKGQGLILSASPRTLFEAEAELPVFEEMYGRENLKIFNPVSR